MTILKKISTFIKKKKLFSLCQIILSSPYGLACALIIRILYFFINIKVGCLNTKVIGHMSMETYVSLKNSSSKKKVLNLVCYKKKEFICNNHLIKIWKRSPKLTFLPEEFIIPIIRWNNILPYRELFLSVNSPYGCRDIYRKPNETNSINFAFTKNENSFGKKKLKEIGIPDKAKFVCLHVRDSGYKKIVDPDFDWSYHNHRDVNISSYRLAIQHLVKKGFYIVRIGKGVNEKLSSKSHFVIDYANSCHQSDLMDIYLIAKCEFMMSNGSGIDGIAQMFHKPILFSNLHSVGHVHSWNNRSIAIFKKYKCLKTDKILPLENVFERNLDYIENTSKFNLRKIMKIENTQNELKNAVEEMTKFYTSGSTSKKTKKMTNFFWETLIKYRGLKNPFTKVKAHNNLNLNIRHFP